MPPTAPQTANNQQTIAFSMVGSPRHHPLQLHKQTNHSNDNVSHKACPSATQSHKPLSHFCQDDFIALFHLKQEEAAKEVGACLSIFKRKFHSLRPRLRWPSTKERLLLCAKKELRELSHDHNLLLRSYAENERLIQRLNLRGRSVTTAASTMRPLGQTKNPAGQGRLSFTGKSNPTPLTAQTLQQQRAVSPLQGYNRIADQAETVFRRQVSSPQTTFNHRPAPVPRNTSPSSVASSGTTPSTPAGGQSQQAQLPSIASLLNPEQPTSTRRIPSPVQHEDESSNSFGGYSSHSSFCRSAPHRTSTPTASSSVSYLDSDTASVNSIVSQRHFPCDSQQQQTPASYASSHMLFHNYCSAPTVQHPKSTCDLPISGGSELTHHKNTHFLNYTPRVR